MQILSKLYSFQYCSIILIAGQQFIDSSIFQKHQWQTTIDQDFIMEFLNVEFTIGSVYRGAYKMLQIHGY